MLLIDDDEREACELDVLLEKRVRADRDWNFTRGERCERTATRARGLRAGHERDGDPERVEPVAKIAPVLLGEQLRRGHERHLQPAAGRARRGRCRDHGLATAHIALQQAHHRPSHTQVRIDFRERACLSTGQAEGQRGEQPLRKARGIRKRQRRASLHGALEHFQTEVMGEQLLEGESPLRGMPARCELIETRLARRAMHVDQSVAQRRQSQWIEHGARNPVLNAANRACRELQLPHGLADERAQPALREPFGAGIDRSECLLQRLLCREHAPIFGVHHLEPEGSAPQLSEAAHARSARQSALLRRREVKEPQRQKSRPIGDARQ